MNRQKAMMEAIVGICGNSALAEKVAKKCNRYALLVESSNMPTESGMYSVTYTDKAGNKTTENMEWDAFTREFKGMDAESTIDDWSEAKEEADGKEPGNATGFDSLKDMAFYLISQGDVFNVMHWHTPSNTAHELLDSVYSLCRSTGDQLAETYMTLSKGDCVPPASKIGIDVNDWKYDHDAVLDRMLDVQDTMNKVVAAHPEYSEGVKNIFADFDENMTTLIYKYSRFDV